MVKPQRGAFIVDQINSSSQRALAKRFDLGKRQKKTAELLQPFVRPLRFFQPRRSDVNKNLRGL
ncbi:MAG: hypothetical protein ACI942_002000 [Planctomycetota bacterium]|jgi:hypothetical protein